MKKLVSLLLASLLLASSVISCGKNQTSEPVETTISETAAESKSAETDSPDVSDTTLSYDPNIVTENGVAKSHIVIFDNADPLEQYASEELAYHIKLVSGAEVSITNEIQEDSLPIIIATPDSLPELEELFPEDLAWLRTLLEETADGIRNWAEDGFAIRMHENKIYIFGAVAKGALNGVYDFIEDNMGIIWTSADESIGTVYTEQPTVTISNPNYTTEHAAGNREKSPFVIRGWHTSGGIDLSTNVTEIMMSRNKMNSSTKFDKENLGLVRYVVAHNVKAQIVLSPLYDPEIDEYWCTDLAGNHSDFNNSRQINFYSEKAVEAVAAYILQYYEGSHIKYAAVGMEDTDWGAVYPEDNEPFEYEPGKFIEPDAMNRKSTVFFTFVNKVARIVKEQRPDLTVTAFSYSFASNPPECDIDDNVWVTFCTYAENVAALTTEPWGDRAEKEFQYMEGWGEKTKNIVFYTYYACYAASAVYQRPIWDRMQSDAQYYAENGFRGIQPEGYADDGSHMFSVWDGSNLTSGESPYTNNDAWIMNGLSNWIFAKLSWNPYEDVDALIKEFCDKSYGDASEYMQEYYRLLSVGWKDGTDLMSTEFNNVPHYATPPSQYWYYFIDINVDGVDLYPAMCEALQNAWDAANDVQKERIRHIKEVWENAEEIFQHCP